MPVSLPSVHATNAGSYLRNACNIMAVEYKQLNPQLKLRDPLHGQPKNPHSIKGHSLAFCGVVSVLPIEPKNEKSLQIS